MTILEVLPSHEYLSCTFQTKEQFLFTDKLAKTDTSTELLWQQCGRELPELLMPPSLMLFRLGTNCKIPVQNPFTDKLKMNVMVIRRLAIKLKKVYNSKTSRTCVCYWWSHNSLKYEGRIYSKGNRRKCKQTSQQIRVLKRRPTFNDVMKKNLLETYVFALVEKSPSFRKVLERICENMKTFPGEFWKLKFRQ